MLLRQRYQPQAGAAPAAVGPARRRRRGAALVETAFVLPLFILFLFFLFEVGRYFMAVNVLKAAARSAARLGATDAGTNTMIQTEVRRLVATLTNPTTSDLTIYIKDGATFDATGTAPTNYAGLPNIEVGAETTENGHLFIVRVELPYRRVAVIPSFYLTGNEVMVGQAMMRKE